MNRADDRGLPQCFERTVDAHTTLESLTARQPTPDGSSSTVTLLMRRLGQNSSHISPARWWTPRLTTVTNVVHPVLSTVYQTGPA
jgi:hypothetical protein